MFTVYKITNRINNKIYIGYTSQRLSARFNGHCQEPRDTIVSRSIRKHGKHNFLIEPLFEFADSAQAKEKEVELIASLRTNVIKFPSGNGMNMTDGGEGASGYRHSDELKQQWRVDRKGTTPTPESVRKRVAKVSKRVYQFTTDGILCNVFNSAKDAGAAVGSCGANISKCCRMLCGTVKGYIFQYNEAFVPRELSVGNEKRVKQYDTNGTLLNTFNSIQQAANTLGVDRSGIDKCIMGCATTSHGFMWSH